MGAENPTGVKRPSLDPGTVSAPKKIKLNLPENQLTSLNDKVTKLSAESDWPMRLGPPRDDPSKTGRFLQELIRIVKHSSKRYVFLSGR